MLFKVVLKSTHLKVDLGGHIFNLLSWQEKSREGACLKRLKTMEGCNNYLEASVQTDSLTLAGTKSKLVERGIAHTPEIRGVRGQMIIVILDALKLVFKLLRH